jgi:putative ABC transport system permease protein
MSLRQHRAPALLSLVAVAASVALATGLETASRSVRADLRSARAAFTGTADLEVVAAKRGMPEGLIHEVASVPGVAAVSPLIRETFRLARSALPLHILGLDLQAEHAAWNDELGEKRVEMQDPLLLLGNQNAVIITETLARRLGLDIHDPFTVRTAAGERTLIVEGLLPTGGLADAFAGQIALMDVWSLQLLLGVEGWIDSIAVRLEKRADQDRAAAAIRERVSGIASVYQTEEQYRSYDPTLQVLDVTAWGISVLGVLVAALLAQAATAQIVESRSRDLARMGCAGLDARGIRTLVAMDASIPSGIGAALGVVGGVLLAPVLLESFSRLAEQVRSVPTDEATLTATPLVIAAGIWLAVAFLGGLPPARRATRWHPLDVLTTTRTPGSPPKENLRYVFGAAGALLSVIAMWLAAVDVPADLRFGFILVLGLGTTVLASGHVLLMSIRMLRPLLVSIPRVGRLIGVSILPSPSAAAMPIAAIAAVVCGLTLISTVLHSLTTTLNEWIAGSYPSGVSVSASPEPGLLHEPILPNTIAAIRSTPGVEDLAIYYNLHPLYQGEEILLGAVSTEVLLRRGALEGQDTPAEQLAAALLGGEISISHGFHHRFGIGPGDAITLDTRNGHRTFRVGGFLRDYSGPAGSLHLDVATFDRHFARTGAHFLGMWTSAPLSDLQDEISRRTEGSQALFFRHGKTLEEATRTIVARCQNLLNILAGLCALFSTIALLNLLTSGMTARRRELAIMQTIGASSQNVTAVVLIDGLLVSTSGSLLGAFLGLLASSTSMDLLFEHFGWVMRFSVNAGTVVSIAVAVMLISLAAGLLSLWTVGRILPVAALTSE